MDYLSKYLGWISRFSESILSWEKDSFKTASEIIAVATVDGKVIHIIGTDSHSSILAEEFFYRPGSLMNISPIFDPGFSVTHGAYRSSMIQNLTGYAKPVLDYYKINKGDVVIIVSSSGVSSIAIETVIEAKKRHAEIIAITSKEFARQIPENFELRHTSGQNLYEMREVSVVIDSHVPYGDCIIEMDEIDEKMGPVSTIACSIILGILNAQSVKSVLNKGKRPDILKSPYSNGSLNHNEKMIEKYYEIIKHL